MEGEKQREAYSLAYKIGIGAYILIASAILHIGNIMSTEYISLPEAFGRGLLEIFIAPFRIFPISAGTLAWLIVLTAAMIIGTVLLVITHKLKAHDDPDTVLGEAQWLTLLDEYNKKFTDPIGKVEHDGPNNIILSQDIALAMDNKRTRRNLNVFIIGGSGSGKSYNFVGPNLMQANSSYVVTDPSGGLFKEYGKFFEYMGYHVKCFNLSRMADGNHYNPFNYIDGDKDIEILVTTLISNTNPPDKNGGDPFWEKSETALLVALIAYLYHYCEKPLQNFSNVMKLMRAADIDEENPSATESHLDLVFKEVEERDPESFAVKQYKTFKMGAGKTLKGILISCAVRLQAFDLEDVAKLTDTDDIDLDSVGDEKTALFVIIPTGEKTFNFLASMMYSQLFQRLYGYCEGDAKFGSLIVDSDNQVVKTFRANGPGQEKQAEEAAKEFFEKAKKARLQKNDTYDWWELRTDNDELVGWRGTEDKGLEAIAKIRQGRVIPMKKLSNNGERLPIHTRLILDEFANIGKIPEFPEKVATIRKYEISVAIILQSLSQMKKMYKDEWEELSGNCDSTIYLGGGADQMSTEWISKLLGKETKSVLSPSFSKGGGSVSISRQGVELYSPDRLRTMNEDDCIVLTKSQWAYKGRKYMTHDHPNRKLVMECGSYFFDPMKSQDLLKDLKNNISERKIEHDGFKEQTDSEKERAEKHNEAKEQKSQEFRMNADQNGEQILGDGVQIDTKKDSVTEKLGLSNKQNNKSIEESLIETTDDAWGLSEIEFGSRQMS